MGDERVLHRDVREDRADRGRRNETVMPRRTRLSVALGAVPRRYRDRRRARRSSAEEHTDVADDAVHRCPSRCAPRLLVDRAIGRPYAVRMGCDVGVGVLHENLLGGKGVRRADEVADEHDGNVCWNSGG